MANKLNGEEGIKSVGALQEFYFACNKKNGPMTVDIDVLFKRNRKLAFHCLVPIVIAFDNTKTAISIMWEEADYTREEFREIGLYGTYSCQYIKMKYLKTKRILEIKSSDSNKIIRVNAI
ncbi:hypothetical protein [Clostridium oceanicum]|uniref:Uncharacterized protein n=1 Tax=Clostridium oceanicum TaxID=1543 RepID=A0ABN1JCD8_9CLOT